MEYKKCRQSAKRVISSATEKKQKEFASNLNHPEHQNENWGGGCAPVGGSPSNTMWQGPRPTSVPSGILTIQSFGHNRHGPKIGGCATFGEGELGPHLKR